MNWDAILSVLAVIGVCFTGWGLIKTIRKNGKELRERDIKLAKIQAARDQKISSNQEAILTRLDDKEHGLQAVNDKIAKINTRCAQVSTGLSEKVLAAERDIRELKGKQ